MSGRLGNYLDLVSETQRLRIRITRDQQMRIAKLYQAIAEDLKAEQKKHNKKSLKYRWLRDYTTSLQNASNDLFKKIGGIVSGSVHSIAQATVSAEYRFYRNIAPQLSDRFRDVFSHIPQQVVDELMHGGVYKDFAGLSERIWAYQRKYDLDIQTIINRGILQQKSVVALAKDLEHYLNPQAAKPWNWGVVYPSVNRQVDYNTQRLARTSITHAYQLAFVRATRDNPFVEGYQWLSSNSGRTCPICMERDGKFFGKDSVPLDHPNGMCTLIAVITKSYEEIGAELGDWAAGGDNPALDRWLLSRPNCDTIALSNSEQYALNDYISSGSYKLNYALRHSLPLTEEQLQLVRDLDSALEKFPSYEGTVYRSLSDMEIDDIDDYLKGYAVGSYHEYSSYLSTGTEVYDASMPIQFVITSKSGRDIRIYNPNECEILFMRQTGFWVTKVEGNTIYMTEG
ncbi:MAG: hypothetical protein HFE39_07220 [Clostridiales bacterium]|jgi:SPP1 gp7 family putative phage head morphogenesis protein|nr:hypothetical protein [Clostridiales bacterium]